MSTSIVRAVAGLAYGGLFAALCSPQVAYAQLIRDEVRGEQRVCTYFGSELQPNDTVVGRTVIVGLGQNCPATAPYRDPQAPVPANAALLREETAGASRICVFGQGGIEYSRTIPILSRCAMTPALLERQLASSSAGQKGR